MKFTSITSKIIALTFLFSLYGCTTLPNHIIVAPEIATTPAVNHKNKQAQLNIIDMRTAPHIVQVLRENKAATTVSAQEKLENTIKKSLSKHWEKQHLTLNNNAMNKINISIEKAIISVNQSRFEYKVQTEIVLQVTINNGDQTLTMTFKNRGNSDGPLQADIAVLERNFNERLAKLLQQILATPKIINFLI